MHSTCTTRCVPPGTAPGAGFSTPDRSGPPGCDRPVENRAVADLRRWLPEQRPTPHRRPEPTHGGMVLG
jgi:hypothetical protein